jgi:hypothetical protein
MVVLVFQVLAAVAVPPPAGAAGIPCESGTAPVAASSGSPDGACPTPLDQVRVAANDAATAEPGNGYIVQFSQQTPSAVATILILLVAVAAGVVILALRRESLPQ